MSRQLGESEDATSQAWEELARLRGVLEKVALGHGKLLIYPDGEPPTPGAFLAAMADPATSTRWTAPTRR